MASPAEVFDALRQAHAKADAEAAAALYAPDAVYYEPDNVPHRGRDEIRTHLASVYAVRGPIELTVKRQVGADQTATASALPQIACRDHAGAPLGAGSVTAMGSP